MNLDEFTFDKITKYKIVEEENGESHILCRKKSEIFSGILDLSELNVTEIESFLFQGNVDIKKVILPKTLLTIGDGAFYKCKNLEEVVFPDTLVKIGAYSFSNCALTSFTAPNTLKWIGHAAFKENNINDVFLNANLDMIEYNAFSKNKIELIIIPNETNVRNNFLSKQRIEKLPIVFLGPNLYSKRIDFLFEANFYENTLENILRHVSFKEANRITKQYDFLR